MAVRKPATSKHKAAADEAVFEQGHAAAGGSGHDGAGGMRWLLTYADLVTLLLIFFIILYNLARQDISKTQATAALMQFEHALQQQFMGSQPMGLTQKQASAVIATSPVNGTPHHRPAQSAQSSPSTAGSTEYKLAAVSAQLEAALKAKQLQSAVRVEAAPQDVTIVFSSKVYFASASAYLQPGFAKVLATIAPVLRRVPYQIQVRGFTNNLPLVSRKYATAWELGAARAVNVLRFLTETQGVDPHLMVAESYGQWNEPYADIGAGLRLNRSVDLVITDHGPAGVDQGGPDTLPVTGQDPWPPQYGPWHPRPARKAA